MTQTAERTVGRLVEALAAGDRASLEDILDPGVPLRALLPRRTVEVTGAAGAIGEMLGWLAEVPEVVPVETRVDLVGDVWHAGYRFLLRGLDPQRIVEQHAYCTVEGGRITGIRVICSGFRPAPTPAVTDLDALGDSCATLTPRIAAGLRTMAPGDLLAVLTDDPSAPEGIAAWSRLTGHPLVATRGNRFYLRHS
jgi:TusA-related sulfurtransferase